MDPIAVKKYEDLQNQNQIIKDEIDENTLTPEAIIGAFVFFWGSLAAALPFIQSIFGFCLILLAVFLLFNCIEAWVKMWLVNLIVTILMAQLLHEIVDCEWNDLRGVTIIGACLIYNILCGCCIFCYIQESTIVSISAGLCGVLLVNICANIFSGSNSNTYLDLVIFLVLFGLVQRFQVEYKQVTLVVNAISGSSLLLIGIWIFNRKRENEKHEGEIEVKYKQVTLVVNALSGSSLLLIGIWIFNRKRENEKHEGEIEEFHFPDFQERMETFMPYIVVWCILSCGILVGQLKEKPVRPDDLRERW